MITRIEIDNFKAIKHLELDCSGLNLLTGLNGMGKSSVMQTMLLLNQSNGNGNLSINGLNLKGEWINIGVGKDALYENADKEIITFNFKFKDLGEKKWEFGYDSTADTLPFLEGLEPPKNFEELSLFDNQRFQYLSAERWVLNKYERSDFQVVQNRNLGKHGQFATHFLTHYKDANDLKVPLELCYENHATSNNQKGEIINTLEHQVSQWMNVICPGTKVRPKDDGFGFDDSRLRYQFDNNGLDTEEFKPINVGFGITYVLSVLVVLLGSKPGDLLLLENPESHLHPRGQSAIGKLMTLVANNGVQIFVESHSDHILNGIRVAVKDGVPPEMIKLHYFSRNIIEDKAILEVTTPELDSEGGIKNWPENFFDQARKDLNYLFDI